MQTPHKGALGVYAIVSLADGYESTHLLLQAKAKGSPLANADLIAAAPELLEALTKCWDATMYWAEFLRINAFLIEPMPPSRRLRDDDPHHRRCRPSL